ncbi:MAG: VCBS repeat-containing protein, partial [Bacteroidetes bacterium]|nr:VCBS repeat-containing protein [Bacteroidota bacterium]
MKKTITLMSTGLFLLSGAHFNFLFAQQFSKVSGGDIVNTPSDSRSVNIIDVNGDGFEDVFISNGLKGGQNNLLYLNNGNGTFTTETNNPIIEDNSPSVGASFGDIDNDGDIDACVTNWYGEVNNFYKNSGNGKFIVNTGLGNSGSYAETATWGDYDKDGFLDLYITNSAGGNKNMLYHNQGNGIFTRIFTGDLVNESDLSRNANWVDYDLDGDLDLFVTNEDNTANDLYENDGNGVLNKKYLGILTGSSKSSMSSSWVDIDNDGDMDLFIANAGYFQEQNNQIFRNDSGTFTLVDTGPVVSDGGCSYGSNFADYDNDGDLDLLVTN